MKLLLISFGFATITMIILRLIINNDFFFTKKFKVSKSYKNEENDLEEAINNAMIKSNYLFIKKKDNKFVAYTLISIWSFSEIITIEIIEENENKRVNFSSSCYFLLQIIDWGKNKRNANLFFKNLESYLKN